MNLCITAKSCKTECLKKGPQPKADGPSFHATVPCDWDEDLQLDVESFLSRVQSDDLWPFPFPETPSDEWLDGNPDSLFLRMFIKCSTPQYHYPTVHYCTLYHYPPRAKRDLIESSADSVELNSYWSGATLYVYARSPVFFSHIASHDNACEMSEEVRHRQQLQFKMHINTVGSGA